MRAVAVVVPATLAAALAGSSAAAVSSRVTGAVILQSSPVDRRLQAFRPYRAPNPAAGARRPSTAGLPPLPGRGLGIDLGTAVASAGEGSASPGYRFAVSLAKAGPRPAASANERRAQLRVRRVFVKAGLRVTSDRFRVPRHGTSRNVIGIRETSADCLVILMAHSDSTPTSPGAVDNGSGLGALVEFAPRLQAGDPPCDVWLVATGAEERIYTGRPDHLGATALVKHVKRQGRARHLRLALSLDEVGRGTTMWLRSNARDTRRNVEGAVMRAARGTGLGVRWVRDDGSGNSDHREFQIRGLPAAKLGVTSYAYRHTPRDTRDKLTAATFPKVRRLLEALVE